MSMTPTAQPWYFSRMIWFSILTAAISVVGILTKDFPEVGIFGTMASVINILLRLDTSLPIQQ